jgi:hypothetical protein
MLWCARRLCMLIVPLCLVLCSFWSSPALASEPLDLASAQETECPVKSVELTVLARRTTPVIQAYLTRLSEQPWGQGLAKQGKKVYETPESEVRRSVIGCSPRRGVRNTDDDAHHAAHIGPVDQVVLIVSLLPGVPAGRAPPSCYAI